MLEAHITHESYIYDEYHLVDDSTRQHQQSTIPLDVLQNESRYVFDTRTYETFQSILSSLCLSLAVPIVFTIVLKWLVERISINSCVTFIIIRV